MSDSSYRASQRRRKRRVRPQFILFCFVCCLILFGAGFLLGRSTVRKHTGDIVPAFHTDSQSDPVPAGYHRADDRDSGVGSLILVNNDVLYTFPESVEKVAALERIGGNYLVRDGTILLEAEAQTAFDSMLSAFANATGLHDVNITSAYRSYDEQKAVYENSAAANGEEHARRYVAVPGGSEHHTGLAVDLNRYDVSRGVCYDFDGSGDYGWIAQNCRKYGIILRYAADKEGITGIAEETWHFRYVGIPHAALMAEKGLCLEEYVSLLRQYPCDGAHLRTDGYELYYCPAGNLCVPDSGDYTVSGDNQGGFIVTVKK